MDRIDRCEKGQGKGKRKERVHWDLGKETYTHIHRHTHARKRMYTSNEHVTKKKEPSTLTDLLLLN